MGAVFGHDAGFGDVGDGVGFDVDDLDVGFVHLFVVVWKRSQYKSSKAQAKVVDIDLARETVSFQQKDAEVLTVQ